MSSTNHTTPSEYQDMAESLLFALVQATKTAPNLIPNQAFIDGNVQLARAYLEVARTDYLAQIATQLRIMNEPPEVTTNWDLEAIPRRDWTVATYPDC